MESNIRLDLSLTVVLLSIVRVHCDFESNPDPEIYSLVCVRLGIAHTMDEHLGSNSHII